MQAVEANGAAVWLSPNGPIGDWRHDIDRPPLGSLTGMLFRAMVDPHLALGMTYENWSRMTRVAPLRAAGGRLLSGLRR